MPEPLVEPAPAKINLALHVTGRRADGFHDLSGLAAFAEIGDRLTARPASADSLKVTGPFAPGLSDGPDNLVRRAVAEFRAEWPDRSPAGVRIELEKTLPVASGLGGGSADAAAALRIMARLASRPVELDRLAALAGRLGADVPMCVGSVACEIAGRGEVVRPIAPLPECQLVLVNPGIPLLTEMVFNRLESRNNPAMPVAPDSFATVAELAGWLAGTRNDLEAPAGLLVPEIGAIADALRQTPGCRLARLSGSGATVFGLFDSRADASQAATQLRHTFPAYWITASKLRAGAISQ